MSLTSPVEGSRVNATLVRSCEGRADATDRLGRDGVPDEWEKARGLQPDVADAAKFGRARGCATGYTALECYLNELADARTGR